MYTFKIEKFNLKPKMSENKIIREVGIQHLIVEKLKIFKIETFKLNVSQLDFCLFKWLNRYIWIRASKKGLTSKILFLGKNKFTSIKISIHIPFLKCSYLTFIYCVSGIFRLTCTSNWPKKFHRDLTNFSVCLFKKLHKVF